ncbi:hypothetical protein HPB50_002147 [Hyalomma asiaticum]|uniref:Uncharacterized protein n=1 Tax=Hyalomma asiaticum TaxID=266040 RepID=A0ACB7RMW7_HYAAI|nr:hypothetical protein HPB50_002147 [Hyalomma asiaticum]
MSEHKKVLLLNALGIKGLLCYLRAVEEEPQPGEHPETSEDTYTTTLLRLEEIFNLQQFSGVPVDTVFSRRVQDGAPARQSIRGNGQHGGLPLRGSRQDGAGIVPAWCVSFPTHPASSPAGGPAASSPATSSAHTGLYFRCGSSQHWADSGACRARSRTCARCGKHGHFAKLCRSSGDPPASSSPGPPTVTNAITVLQEDAIPIPAALPSSPGGDGLQLCEKHFHPSDFVTSTSYTDTVTDKSAAREGPEEKRARMEAKALQDALQESLITQQEEEQSNAISSLEDLFCHTDKLLVGDFRSKIIMKDSVWFLNFVPQDGPEEDLLTPMSALVGAVASHMSTRTTNEDDSDGARYLPPVDKEHRSPGHMQNDQLLVDHGATADASVPNMNFAAAAPETPEDETANKENGAEVPDKRGTSPRPPTGRMTLLEGTLSAENEVRIALLREEHAMRMRLMEEELQQRNKEHELKLELLQVQKKVELAKLNKINEMT